MNIGKLNISKWEYGGRKLAHPLKIARRMIFFPIFYAFRFLYCASIAGALGIKSAKQAWRDTE